MADKTITDQEKCPYILTLKDDNDNARPAEDGDVATVTSSDTSIATVVPDATVVVAGAAGTGWILAVNGSVGTVTIDSYVTRANGDVLRPDETTLVTVTASAPSGVLLTLGDAVAQ